MFGAVIRRRMDTPPDALVLRIIEPKQFVSSSTEYGKRMESIALEKYKAYKNDPPIVVCSAGFVIYRKSLTLERLQMPTSMIRTGKSSMD